MIVAGIGAVVKRVHLVIPIRIPLDPTPNKLAELTGDGRYSDYWKFVNEGRTEIYLQRVSDASYTTSGYNIQELMGLTALSDAGRPPVMAEPDGQGASALANLADRMARAVPLPQR